MTPVNSRIALLCATLLLGGGTATTIVGCGGDEPAASPSGASKRSSGSSGKSRRRSSSSKKGKRGRRLDTYPKVDDQYRHKFTERDFQPDIGGDENRNPFRSYVVRMRGSRSRVNTNTDIDGTDVCTKENSIATSYSRRDLRLIGIVLRGTKSYALFRDSGGLGHIVTRGDCLGKEKAQVESISAGLVRLKVIPTAPPGGAAPAPQTDDIPLHPQEIPLTPNDEIEE